LELLSVIFMAVLTSYVFKGIPADLYVRLGVLAMYYVMIVCISRVYMRFRYVYALDSVYTLDGRGVTIRQPEVDKHVAWEEFTRAEYLPVIPLFRLYSPMLPNPVVLFAIVRLTAQRSDNWRTKETKELLKQGIGRNFTTRWLPW
jgi:hypothetical protein